MDDGYDFKDSEEWASRVLGPTYYLASKVQSFRCVIKDRSHRYVYVNQTWLDVIGIKSARSVLGKTVMEVFPLWRAQRYIDEERQIIHEGRVYEYEEFLLNSQGKTERWRTIKAPWQEDGKIMGCINVGFYLDTQDGLEKRGDVLPELVSQLAAHACDAISLDDLAKQNGISRRTFERRFRELMSESPLQFRTRCRLVRAKQLLKKGALMTDVSQVCGFSDQSHFTKTFQKYEGMTPKQYQKLQLR